MRRVKTPENKTAYYFVDESGDPIFYGKGGSVIVGQLGCSRVLMLGYVEVSDPTPLQTRINELKAKIATDSYLRAIPSIVKTVRAFHAKDDCPEVRMMMYKLLAPMDFTAQMVVARKHEPMFRTRYRGDQDRFYDELVTLLFENRLHRNERNRIVFARRGSKTRQRALREAILDSVSRFQKKWGKQVSTTITVETAQPSDEPLLQVVDYTNWALYRAFERGEMRYFDFIRDKVELVRDVFDREKYRGGLNFYTRTKNPFSAEKISPLG
jgi:hypothetical protein